MLCGLCRFSQVSGEVVLWHTWPSVSWVSWVPLFASQSCPSLPSSLLSHELTVFSIHGYGQSQFLSQTYKPTGFECGAEQGALYVGNSCSLEIINTNTPKRVSYYMVIILPFLTDRAALLIVEWHLEEWEKTLSLQRPTSPPGLGARVTIVLGSGVSEEKTWRLSMSYLLTARA